MISMSGEVREFKYILILEEFKLVDLQTVFNVILYTLNNVLRKVIAKNVKDSASIKIP
jgi:hypothetical protein